MGDEHLRAIAGPEAVAAATDPEARHDAISYSPRHGLIGVVAQALAQDELAEETARALEYFTGWSETHVGDPEALLREGAALLALLQRAHAAQRWPDVVRLGRAIESAYALGQRWTDWGRVLELVLDAARRSEDLETEGWARHQLGTRAYGLGDVHAARDLLQQALAVRERIGDRAGAAATRQNLRVICGPTPLIYRLSHVCLSVLAFVCALVVGAAGVAGAAFLADGDATAQLTVGVQGDGVVVSDDGAIRCAQAKCHKPITGKGELLLRPEPHGGWEFVRWDGGCSGRGACRLIVTSDIGVLAQFKRVRQLHAVRHRRCCPKDVGSRALRLRSPGGVAHDRRARRRPRPRPHPTVRNRLRPALQRQLPTRNPSAPDRDRAAGLALFRLEQAGVHACDPHDVHPRAEPQPRPRRTLRCHRRPSGSPSPPSLRDLRVSVAGKGTVSSDPGGIDACAQPCSAAFLDGQRVVLTATASQGWKLAGWNHADCDHHTTCTLTLDGTRTVGVAFRRQKRPPPSPSTRDLRVTVTGKGTVSSDPAEIDACAQACSAAYPDGQRVVLTATAANGWDFAGWAHPGCDQDTTCMLTLEATRTVQATFRRRPIPPPPLERKPTAIAVRQVKGTTSPCCDPRDRLNVLGQLDGAPPRSSVQLESTLPASSTGLPPRIFETVTTRDDGGFSAPLNPPAIRRYEPGIWRLVARYAGTIAYAPSQSKPFEQRVAVIPQA